MPQAAIDRDALDRLVALGLRQGGLTTSDLARALPVDAMDPTDIALVVADLEDRGVPVELDDAFLLGPAREPPAPPAFELAAPRAEAPAPVAPRPDEGAFGDAVPRDGQPAPPEPAAAAHRAVVLGGALALLVLGAILFLAARLG